VGYRRGINTASFATRRRFNSLTAARASLTFPEIEIRQPKGRSATRMDFADPFAYI
jgi:hypothetical protein